MDWTVDISSGHGPFFQPPTQQSPPESSAKEVYPFTRSVYFAIISTKAIPKQVIIRGKANGKDVSICVDVESTKFGHESLDPLFIHTLAAHRIIRDLKGGSRKGKHSETAQRREIVRLGEHHQLVSSHTSFVVVDHGVVRPHHQNQQGPPNSPFTMTSVVSMIWHYLIDPIPLFRSPAVDSQPKQCLRDGLLGG